MPTDLIDRALSRQHPPSECQCGACDGALDSTSRELADDWWICAKCWDAMRPFERIYLRLRLTTSGSVNGAAGLNPDLQFETMIELLQKLVDANANAGSRFGWRAV